MEHKQVKKKGDGYAKRRKLFKHVWDAPLNLEDENHRPGTKAKVIKTLRLSETEDINIGKGKKERIQYLRTVCTHLLDLCNRRDPDELNEMMNAARQESSNTSICVTPSPKGKKKRVRKKKKIQRVSTNRTLSVAQSDKDKLGLSVDAKVEGPITHRGTIPLRQLSAPRLNRSSFIRQYLDERNNLEKDPPKPVTPVISETKPAGDALRKVVKKKHRTRTNTAIVQVATKVSKRRKKASGTKRNMKSL